MWLPPVQTRVARSATLPVARMFVCCPSGAESWATCAPSSPMMPCAASRAPATPTGTATTWSAAASTQRRLCACRCVAQGVASDAVRAMPVNGTVCFTLCLCPSPGLCSAAFALGRLGAAVHRLGVSPASREHARLAGAALCSGPPAGSTCCPGCAARLPRTCLRPSRSAASTASKRWPLGRCRSLSTTGRCGVSGSCCWQRWMTRCARPLAGVPYMWSVLSRSRSLSRACHSMWCVLMHAGPLSTVP